MRRVTVVALCICAATAGSRAQVAVFDVAVTIRNSITAAIKEQLVAVQNQQHSQLRRMAQRLSLFTDLGKYSLAEPPLWRIHDFETPLFAGRYHAALNYGDEQGAAFVGVSQSLIVPERWPTTAVSRRAVVAQLATLQAADASAIAATNESGRLRYNGRKEAEAINSLDRDVINSSNEQSATAVLDKISGAVLVGARQRQARVQLLSAVVEQLLVDGKRTRDSDAATINMALVALRDRPAVDSAFVRGSGDALRTWRQP